MWAIASDRRKDLATVDSHALQRQTDRSTSSSSSSVAIAPAVVQRPSWCPAAVSSSGDSNFPITPAELLNIGATAHELEREWADMHNGAVGMDMVLDNPFGPQRLSEQAIAQAIRAGAELDDGIADIAADTMRKSCAFLGDCDRYGRLTLDAGDMVTDAIGSYIRLRSDADGDV